MPNNSITDKAELLIRLNETILLLPLNEVRQHGNGR